MNKTCIRCYVEGRVQGVFYRAAARKKALELGLTGWAKNLSDGRVQILVCGDFEKVEEFRNWLWDGSERSEVTDVVVDEVTWEEYEDFEVL